MVECVFYDNASLDFVSKSCSGKIHFIFLKILLDLLIASGLITGSQMLLPVFRILILFMHIQIRDANPEAEFLDVVGTKD
jgi:hypothetical protein